MIEEDKINFLKQKAKNIRKHIIRMLTEAGSGHPGGSLSCADILSVLYFHHMRHNPKNPKWEDRDRFILSKGHAAPVLYATLAEAGYFPVEELKTLRKIGSILQGHPDMKKTPGLDMSSGSLGQGLSIANGIALAGRLNNKNYRVYTLHGDGELAEGQLWEAAMAASHYEIDNLCAILDFNGLQIDGPISEVMDPNPIPEKFKSFGWNVIEIDGHDIHQIIDALEEAGKVKEMPTIIIAHTIKGKGVSFMENGVEWHGMAPNREQCEIALRELDEDN